MATEVTNYGFAPGPRTTKDLEPKPEPKSQPLVQLVQPTVGAEAIILVLAVAIALLAAGLLIRNLRLPVA